MRRGEFCADVGGGFLTRHLVVLRRLRAAQVLDDGGMKKDELVDGQSYALRPKASESDIDDSLVKVTYVGLARGRQCKVRYDGGDLEGLEEWALTRQLLCLWTDRNEVLRDEECAARMAAADAKVWDRVTEDAISTVMTASGEYGGFLGGWESDPESAQRYWDRDRLVGTPLTYDEVNYRDRHGMWQLSFATALAASQAFAAAEPELVDLYVRGWGNQLKAEGFTPGMSHKHDLLREWAPRHALARAWSQEPRGLAAENEATRLRRLVVTAIHELRAAGAGFQADRIERGLHGL